MNEELQIIDLVVGEGKKAVKGALITTQYRGWLEDGSEFDSSWSRGKPFQCVIGTGRVIKGWESRVVMEELRSNNLVLARKAKQEKSPQNANSPKVRGRQVKLAPHVLAALYKGRLRFRLSLMY